MPVVSWLVLGGKCANCKAPISARYPLIELLTGVASGVVAWRLGFGVDRSRRLCCSPWALIALTFIDLDTLSCCRTRSRCPLVWLGLLL